MHYLYIIYSHAADRYYIGETINLPKRLQDHNNHKFKKSFTKAADDWKIVLEAELKSKEEAVFLEQFIKRMKSRKFIEKIIYNPAILQDLLRKSSPWFTRSLGAGGTT